MVGTRSRIGALAALVIGAGCSTGSSSYPASRVMEPVVPDVSAVDRDRDRIDDAIDTQSDELVAVEAIFRAPMPAGATAEFEAAGGTVRHVLHHIGYGFTGRIPRSALVALAPKLGSGLLLLKQEHPVVPHLDESTRTSRARAVWAAGFAGSASGFNGSNKVNIAIVDSGVDATHPDLQGRLLGYKDFTAEAVAEPKDMMGHGTHVAGIALGSGAAFGVGPGTLAVTDWADATDPDDPLGPNGYHAFPYHLPPTFTISGTATFEGTSATLSFLRADDGTLSYTDLETTPAQASPFAFSFDGTSGAGAHFTLGLRQNAAKDVKRFALASKITSFPAAGDGFPALRGVAPQSGYYAAKIFPANGVGDTSDVTAALDEIDALHEALDIKVINCSFGARDVALRAKVATLVSHGIVVVASAGNNGGTGETLEPGSSATALTVGAASDANLLTRYSSGRAKLASETDTDDKPDVLAPGGSPYRSKVIAPDTNWTDAENSNAIPDVQKDDYTSQMGTSMAAPIVAGGAALVIQALEAKGLVWDYKSAKTSLLVKMLLLATATETNQRREGNEGHDPSLGRAATPKDTAEGFGLVNIDAAIEAATRTWDFKDPITGTTTGAPSDRRAWARKVTVPKGQTIKVALTSDATADFDLHVYRSSVNGRGTPQLQAWSSRAGLGLREETTWTFLDETELYVVVKRIEGAGGFTLTGATFTCGNGTVEPGEECDDSSDCCNAGCQLEETLACTTPDAGAEDAGADAEPSPEPDAAVVEDASTEEDAAVAVPSAPSAPSIADAGGAPAPAGPRRVVSGGCATAPEPRFGSVVLAVLALLSVRRRRRFA